jgi:hypothetical protein
MSKPKPKEEQTLEVDDHFFVPDSLRKRKMRPPGHPTARSRTVPEADNYSFDDLICYLRDHKGEHSMPSEASLANTISALKSFASDEGYATDRPIGSVLRVSFYRKRNVHLERLRARGEAKTYVNNRSYALGVAHRALLHLDRAQAAAEGNVRPLAVALQAVAAEV